jgi:hypothetical protein
MERSERRITWTRTRGVRIDGRRQGAAGRGGGSSAASAAGFTALLTSIAGEWAVASAICTLPSALRRSSLSPRARAVVVYPSGTFNFPRRLRCGARRETPSASRWPRAAIGLRADPERSGHRMDGQLTLDYRTYGPLYSSSIRSSQQDSLFYTQFSRTHPSSISSSIHYIHSGTYLSLYLNMYMCDLVLKDLLRRI